MTIMHRGRKRGGGGGGGGIVPSHFIANNFLLSAMPLHGQMTLSSSINV